MEKVRFGIVGVGNMGSGHAKSFLGVHLARMAWNEIYVETDFDCYFDFEKFICE